MKARINTKGHDAVIYDYSDVGGPVWREDLDLDLLIASIALTAYDRLVTRNVKHFSQIPRPEVRTMVTGLAGRQISRVQIPR